MQGGVSEGKGGGALEPKWAQSGTNTSGSAACPLVPADPDGQGGKREAFTSYQGGPGGQESKPRGPKEVL